jgi:hypothetical protein
LENVAKYFIGGDFSYNGAEMVDGFADVLGGEVCRESGSETVADTEEGSAGVGESLDMSLVGDQGGITVCEEILL